MVEKKSIKEELEKTKEDLADLEMYIEEFSTFGSLYGQSGRKNH